MGGAKPIFRRQVPIGSIIADFYCSAAKLAVEVDGRTHWDDDAQARDEARDYWLAQQGIAVMRIRAGRMYRELGEVADGVIFRAEAEIRGGEVVEAASPLHHSLFPRPKAGVGERCPSSVSRERND